MRLCPLLKTALIVLAMAGMCDGQRGASAPTSVTLRVFVTIDSDSDKAANVTVELMDAVGFSSAMDSKLTDSDGVVNFRTLSGAHRIRITGPNIQTYEGDLEITPNETSHLERIRVRRAQGDRLAGESPPGNLVPAIRLHIPASARKAFEKGAEAMRQHLWEKSRTLFDTAIRDSPHNDLPSAGLRLIHILHNQPTPAPPPT